MPSYLFKADGINIALPVTPQGDAWSWLELGSGGSSIHLWLINIYTKQPILQLSSEDDFPRPARGMRPMACDVAGALLAQELDMALTYIGRVYKISRLGVIQYTDSSATSDDEVNLAWFDSLGRLWCEIAAGDSRAKIMHSFDYVTHLRTDEWSASFGTGQVGLLFRAGAIAGRVYASQRSAGFNDRLGYFDALGAWHELVTFTGPGGGRAAVGRDGSLFIGNPDSGERNKLMKFDSDGNLLGEVVLTDADASYNQISSMLEDSLGRLWIQGVGSGLFLDLPGTSGNYASTPDSPKLKLSQNWLPWSEDLTQWNDVNGVTVTPDTYADPNGDMTIDTLTDASAAAFQGKAIAFTVPNDGATYKFACLIRKDFSATQRVGINFSLSGGTPVNIGMRFALDGTGQNANVTMTSYDSDYWLVSGTTTNNNSGNTLLQVQMYPATAPTKTGIDNVSAIGSASFGWVRVQRSATLLPYVKTEGVAKKGDIDIRVKAALNDWTPSGHQVMIGVWNSPRNRFLFRIESGGALAFYLSVNGTGNAGKISSVNPSVSDGQILHLKATWEASSGLVTLYTSNDGIAWSQLGTTSNIAAGNSIFNSTEPMEIGSQVAGTTNLFNGKIYYAEVRDGIDGPLISDFNPERDAAPGAISFVSSTTGETYTINQSGSPAAEIKGLPSTPLKAWCVNGGTMEVEIFGEVANARIVPGQDFDGQSAVALIDNPPTGRNQLGIFQFAERIDPDDVDLGLDIVKPLCLRAGLDEYEINVESLIGTPVIGYVIASRSAVREMIEPLMGIFFFDAVESDDAVKFVMRGNPSAISIPQQDLGAEENEGSEDNELIDFERQQEMELPVEINLAYLSSSGAYEASQQLSRRLITQSRESVTISVPVVLTDNQAKRAVDSMMFNAWLEREKLSFRTSRKYLAYEPTDVLTVNRDGVAHLVRITQKNVGANGVVEWSSVLEEPSNYTQFSSGNPMPDAGSEVFPPTPTLAELLDIPMLRDIDNNPGFYYGAYGLAPDQWPGSVLFQSVDGGGAYVQMGNSTLLDPTTVGEALTALPNQADMLGFAETGEYGSPEWNGLFDEANTVDVVVANGATLADATRDQLLNGANAFLLGREVAQFRDQVLLSPNVYRLSGLLRGRLGTEQFMDEHIPGDRFVLLDPNRIRSLSQTFSQLNNNYLYKPVTIGASVQAATPVPFVNTGVRRKPLAPWRFAGGRDGSDNLIMRWKPRSRFPIHFGLGVDNPSGETEERYVVYIPSFAAAIRTIVVSTPTATYTAAQQTEDYGSPQLAIEAEVCQVSPEFGLGYFTSGVF